MLKYHADFEFTHTGSEDKHIATTSFEAEREPTSEEDFYEISKVLGRAIEGCDSLKILRVYEDSDLVRAISSKKADYGDFIID